MSKFRITKKGHGTHVYRNASGKKCKIITEGIDGNKGEEVIGLPQIFYPGRFLWVYANGRMAPFRVLRVEKSASGTLQIVISTVTV